MSYPSCTECRRHVEEYRQTVLENGRLQEDIAKLRAENEALWEVFDAALRVCGDPEYYSVDKERRDRLYSAVTEVDRLDAARKEAADG